MLVQLEKKLKARHIDLVFVSVDEPETEAAAVTFARSHGYSGPVLVAARPLGAFKTALNPDWPGMLPATFLFDPSAKLRHFWGGPAYEGEIEPVLTAFLEGKDLGRNDLPALSPGLDTRL